jgi:hypothetical protein
MKGAEGFFLLLIVFVVCLGLGLLFIVGFGVFLILFAGRRVVAPMHQRQLRSIIEDGMAERDYELLEVTDETSRDHPFADRFGFGFGKRPAVVKRIEARDRAGRTRRGWAYVRAWVTGMGHSGFIPESLEVAWED